MGRQISWISFILIALVPLHLAYQVPLSLDEEKGRKRYQAVDSEEDTTED